MRRRTLLLVPLIAFAAGCGAGPGTATAPKPSAPEVNPAGDIPDNQVYVPFTPPGATFSVKVPEGWSRTSSGGATTFTDKLNSVTVEAVPAKVELTVREAHATEVPKLARSTTGFKPGKVSAVTRQAGKAVRIEYLAESPADPVTGKRHRDAVERYVFFHSGQDVVLTLRGPKGADNVDPWRIVSDSLRWSS